MLLRMLFAALATIGHLVRWAEPYDWDDDDLFTVATPAAGPASALR